MNSALRCKYSDLSQPKSYIYSDKANHNARVRIRDEFTAVSLFDITLAFIDIAKINAICLLILCAEEMVLNVWSVSLLLNVGLE